MEEQQLMQTMAALEATQPVIYDAAALQFFESVVEDTFHLSAHDYRCLTTTVEGRAFVRGAWDYWMHEAGPRQKHAYLTKLSHQFAEQRSADEADRAAKRKRAKEERKRARQEERERVGKMARAMREKWPHGVPSSASWRKPRA